MKIVLAALMAFFALTIILIPSVSLAKNENITDGHTLGMPLANPLYWALSPGYWVTVVGLDKDETNQFVIGQLCSALLFGRGMMTSDKNIIVGATWDMASGILPGVDVSDRHNLSTNIEAAAYGLSQGSNLIVAGGIAGPVSEATYNAIIDRANQINSSHGGSIVRIGGEDRNQTARFLKSYSRFYPVILT